MIKNPYHVEREELQPQPVAIVRGHIEPAEIPAFLGAAFGEVIALLADQHLTPAGPPFARWRPTGETFDVEAGFPSSGPVTPEGRVEAAGLPGGTVAKVMHRGDYGAVGAAYEAVAEWLGANGYASAGEPWECYLDGPEVAEPRTLVYFPCRPA
jgi:effector-binding domain-containing protein